MFRWSNITLLVLMTVLTNCGDKKSSPAAVEQLSSQYTLEPFYDVNNESTLKLELLKDLPRVVDLKENMTAVKDQDQRGTCSFFSSIALVEAAIKKKMKVEINLSEEYLNNVVKTGGIEDHYEGSYPENNLSFVKEKKTGFLLERDWPYQPIWFESKSPCLGFKPDDEKAPVECYAHNSPPDSVLTKKINTEKFKFMFLKAETTNELIEVLASYKLPLTMTVPVNDRGWGNSGTTQYTEEMRQECINFPTLCGFHSVVITGYDLDKQVFFFKNSWSTKWGSEGYGTISFDVVDKHVEQVSVLVDLKEDIELPKDYQVDPIKLSDFLITSKEQSNHQLTVEIFGKTEEAGFHTLKTSTVLSKKIIGTAPTAIPSDSNMQDIELSEDEEKELGVNAVFDMHMFWPSNEAREYVWSKEAPEVFNISQRLMELTTIQKLRSATIPNLFARTSVYVYTDTERFKVLKRVYHNLDFQSERSR